MNKLFSLLTIITFFGVAYTQGFPTLPGVIDLKEPDINFTNARHHLNTTVVELKEPKVEEVPAEAPSVDKEGIIEESEAGTPTIEKEGAIEEEEVGTAEKATEKIIEVEEVGIAEKAIEKDTEVIEVNPEENVIFYIPDFGKEEEEDIIIDADTSDLEHEINGDVNDLEGVNLTDYYHPTALGVNPSEYEVVDHPHLSDITDEEDIFDRLSGDIADTDNEHEIVYGINDLESVNLTDYYNPTALNVNPGEIEVVDHPHPSDSPEENDLVDNLDTESKSEIATSVNDFEGVDIKDYDQGGILNLNHLEYEVVDRPPIDYTDNNDWNDNDWDDLDADHGTD